MQEVPAQLAIRVSDLVVGFDKHVVIDHLSLDVRRGEILGLVGASGGGKSVLMRTIIGLIPRQSGEIEVMGERVPSMWAIVADDPAAAVIAVQARLTAGSITDGVVGTLSADTAKALALQPGVPRPI